MDRMTYTTMIATQIEPSASKEDDLISDSSMKWSSPMEIRLKLNHPNIRTSSNNSYSASSFVDFMTSTNDESFFMEQPDSVQSHSSFEQTDDEVLPNISLSNYPLEHSAARNRISVKNNLQHRPLQPRLKLPEMVDEPIGSTNSSDDEIKPLHSHVQKPQINLTDVIGFRAKLRPINPSEENSTSHHLDINNRSVERSSSLNQTRNISERNEELEFHWKKSQATIVPSVKEHIYDNFDFSNRKSFSREIEDDQETKGTVALNTFESKKKTTDENDAASSSELSNVLAKLKQKSAARQLDTENTVTPSMTSVYDTEQIPPKVVKPTNQIDSRSPAADRRKTVAGVQLHDVEKPSTPSWKTLIKERQNRNSLRVEPNSEPTEVERKAEPTSNERDSIRALKSVQPNRINNLIQLFNR